MIISKVHKTLRYQGVVCIMRSLSVIVWIVIFVFWRLIYACLHANPNVYRDEEAKQFHLFKNTTVSVSKYITWTNIYYACLEWYKQDSYVSIAMTNQNPTIKIKRIMNMKKNKYGNSQTVGAARTSENGADRLNRHF